MDLYARHERLDPIDGVLAAVAINRGLDTIVSADRAFDDVPGLGRVDPLDEHAVSALAG